MVVTINPTSNQTPDPGQGGLAVSGNTNTGHGSTTASGTLLPSSQTKTCVWAGFSAVSGQIISARLKFDWSEDGFANSEEDSSNQFQVEYSVNGGSSWLTALVHVNVVAPSGGSADVAISLPLDTTQFQVRDRLFAQGSETAVANVTASISSIQLEITTFEGRPIVLM